MPASQSNCKSEAFRDQLHACGVETTIHENARLVDRSHIKIGRGCRIDDFAFLAGGQSLRLDDRVHIASFSSIAGGGKAVLESFSGLAAGCRLITGSEKYMGEGLTNPCVPDEFRAVKRSKVILRKHTLLFTNVIVFPGVEIGEGCVVSAGSIVSHDLEPWGIYRTENDRLRRVRDRPHERILRLEKKCIQKYGY